MTPEEQNDVLVSRLTSVEAETAQLRSTLAPDQLKATIREAVQESLAAGQAEMGQEQSHHICQDVQCQTCQQVVADVIDNTRRGALQEMAQVPGVMEALQFHSKDPISQL